MTDASSRQVLSIVLSESALGASLATTALFMLFGDRWFGDLSNPLWLSVLFAWLFLVILWSAFAVVRHADCLAVKLGEPYGTLVLTLSVISIEVMMISAVMLTGGSNPTLARETMLAIIMIVLNGMVGITLLLGGLRYGEQDYNLQGATAFLAVIVTLSVIGLILPTYTVTSPMATLSGFQAAFLGATSIGLYAVFLGIQTMRHPTFFMHPELEGDGGYGHADGHGVEGQERSVTFNSVLLVAYLIPIVLLSKQLAIPLDYGIEVLGAPIALGGFLVAALVLAPEGLGALKAAMDNRLQRSVNIYLGSVLATIGLTIPAVLTIGLVTGVPVVLGLEGTDMIMLLLTLMVSILTFTSVRTNILQGAVHLVLFLAYVMLIFEN